MTTINPFDAVATAVARHVSMETGRSVLSKLRSAERPLGEQLQRGRNDLAFAKAAAACHGAIQDIENDLTSLLASDLKEPTSGWLSPVHRLFLEIDSDTAHAVRSMLITAREHSSSDGVNEVEYVMAPPTATPKLSRESIALQQVRELTAEPREDLEQWSIQTTSRIFDRITDRLASMRLSSMLPSWLRPSAEFLSGQPTIVTMGELNQQTSKMIKGIIDSGSPALLTKHGEYIAAIVPLVPGSIENLMFEQFEVEDEELINNISNKDVRTMNVEDILSRCNEGDADR